MVLKLAFTLVALAFVSPARAGEPPRIAVGQLVDSRGQPVEGAVVSSRPPGGTARSRADGWFVLPLEAPRGQIELVVERRHYQPRTLRLTAAQRASLAERAFAHLGAIPISRERTAAFWITVAVFLAMMLLIGATPMHNALASLIGASLLLATSALGHAVGDTLIVYSFRDAVASIDWNVVFLIMGMMIVIAVVEGTGVFRYLAYFAFRSSGGQLWRLMWILMLITAVSSALLDNVTTMLLMTPITIRIAITIDVDPLVLLLPEVMAANVGGLATMVGTPTNILIASYSQISFSSFLLNLTPGVLLALAGLALYCRLLYRRQLAGEAGEAPSALLERLKEGAKIAQPGHLSKAGWGGIAMLALFVGHEALHVPPAVIALLGATALLAWIRPDIEEMIEAVDWTTLVFFITLFMVVGALGEVGLIDQLAVWISLLVGDRPVLAMVVICWLAALISTIIPNIPFTATMLPVVGYLAQQIPGASAEGLFFSLAVGSAMGGNGSLIGASANLITAGISERAGYPLTFGHFFRVGFPALLITVAIGSAWLLLRYVVF